MRIKITGGLWAAFFVALKAVKAFNAKDAKAARWQAAHPAKLRKGRLNSGGNNCPLIAAKDDLAGIKG